MIAGGMWQLLLGTHLSTASKMGGVSNRGAQSTITYGTCIKCLDTEQLFNLLVPGHKYPKMKGDHLYGGTDTHGCFAIYFFNPCFRVLMAWDKYVLSLTITAGVPGRILGMRRACWFEAPCAWGYRKNPLNPPSEIGLSACAIG